MSNEYAGRYPEDSQAVLTLVLGILGVVFCQVLGPFAWSIGNTELRAIEAGRRPPENGGMARAGGIRALLGTGDDGDGEQGDQDERAKRQSGHGRLHEWRERALLCYQPLSLSQQRRQADGDEALMSCRIEASRRLPVAS